LKQKIKSIILAKTHLIIKHLIIIGAGGYGREICDLAKSCKEYGFKYVVKGFLDSNLEALGNRPNYPTVLDTVENYKIQEDDVFVIAIANTDTKKSCAEIIQKKGGRFHTLIHQSAVVAQNTTIGDGCVLGRGVIISNDCVIGNHCTFNSKAMVGHDCKLGNFCNLNAGSFIGGECLIDDGVTVHTYGIVTPRLHIEQNAVVGAGSIVVKNVEAGRTVFGNPAREIY
jgi:sugar O-acyltransferase (sialic acid O-acetyltransferase NeuD family)